MTYQTEEEVAERIRIINREIKWLKESFDPHATNPMGGRGTVEERISNLRHDLKVLREIKRKIHLDWERYYAEHRALNNIFRKYNDDVRPSDAGQDWSWRKENGEVICIIDGMEFREPIDYPKEK